MEAPPPPPLTAYLSISIYLFCHPIPSNRGLTTNSSCQQVIICLTSIRALRGREVTGGSNSNDDDETEYMHHQNKHTLTRQATARRQAKRECYHPRTHAEYSPHSNRPRPGPATMAHVYKRANPCSLLRLLEFDGQADQKGPVQSESELFVLLPACSVGNF